MGLQTVIKKRLQNIPSEKMRSLRTIQILDGRTCLWQGEKALNFSSNNYLGLATHPMLKQRAREWTSDFGTGATGSRLITGNIYLYEEVEKKIAKWKETESALLISSGYQANVSVLATIMKRHDLVFSDRYNHASLLNGIQLSRAGLSRYKHNDLKDLEKYLQKADQKKNKWIVSDSIFSMDGDKADIKGLSDLSQKYGAGLYIDEAHASGVFGKNGGGLCHGFNDIDIVMGTFSKAIGSFGAYIACSYDMRDFLINTCPGFIYTTALPPGVLGAIDAGIDYVMSRECDELRSGLDKKAVMVRTILNENGFNTGLSTTHIIPLILGKECIALDFSKALLKQGILGVPVRPPTVPKGTSRIRFSISAAHTEHDCRRLVDVVIKTAKKLNFDPCMVEDETK